MVLLYFMDGVKFEMVDKYMPFISSLNKKPVMSDFGYSCACHATMYTSRYIEEHNTWFVWKKGNNSPYKWIKKVPILKYMNCIPIKYIITKVTRKMHHNRSFPGIPMLVNLPLKYWSMFEPSEDKFWTDDDYKPEIPNMFSIIKKQGIKHQIIALSRTGNPFFEEKNVDYMNNEFVYFFIGYTDNIMHKFGEQAEESHDYIRKVDNFIKETYKKACKLHDDVTIICYSDHGHIDVIEPKIDINDYFKSEGLNVKNYIHLIESTFARFWFRNNKEKEEVLKVLNKMITRKMGFILNQDYLDKYHLNFNSNEHGDIIFHLSAPHEFTRTIWGFGKTVKSMHGYEPTLEKHYGVFASNKRLAQNREYAYLVDMLPSVLVQLGIDRNGYVLKGKNIVDVDQSD